MNKIRINGVRKPISDLEHRGLQVEEAKLEIERERLEMQKTFEQSKLYIEEAKLEREQRFWNRNSGTLITALVSLAAVLVSSGQVISTWISQDRQLQIASLQKQQELEMIDRQKQKELEILDEQRQRDWNLGAAKFVTDNRKAIFNGTSEEQKLFAKIIATIFPYEVSTSLLERIENASPPAAKPTWRETREAVVLKTPEKITTQKKRWTKQEISKTLNATISAILNNPQISTNPNQELNVDKMKMRMLAFPLSNQFGISIPPSEIENLTTIRQINNYLATKLAVSD